MENTACSPLNIQEILQTVFADPTLVYDRSQYAGGMTNYNYIMNIHGALYVIREPGFKTEKIIDRAAEQQNNRIVSDLGINSECVYFDKETGIKISRFIDQAQTFTAINPASERAMISAVTLLKKIHTSKQPFHNRFYWETELTKYEDIVRSLNCSFFSNYTQHRQQLCAFIQQHVSSLRLVPCHNDAVPENFLMNRRTKASYLIDWEYSGMNDPAWDIAMYIAESCLPQEAVEKFLTYYYGAYQICPDEMIKLKCFVMAQDLLWSVWAMIRHYNGEDFLDYLYNRYSRFCRNLAQLMLDDSYPLAEMVKP
jgi:thiamine kinase-like enzyme